MYEKQRQSIDSRIEREKKAFLEILEKTPVIQIACERSSVSRATFYRWRTSDKEFAKNVETKMSEGNSLINDIAIAQLISSIKDKNLGAIKFWLTKHHPEYADKLHVTAEVQQEIVLTPEQEAIVRRALELVSLPHSYGN